MRRGYKAAAPGEYMMNFDCLDAEGAVLGYNAARFTVVKPPPTPPPPPPPPRPHVIVHTGFGGMARSVARHHPFS
jgi:hypothetical protein